MSASHASSEKSPYQPFQCSICQRRFTRNENLKRHATLHSRIHGAADLACDVCHVTFSRPDLHHRHMKRKHPEQDDQRLAKRRQSNQTSSRPKTNLGSPPSEDHSSSSVSPGGSDHVWSPNHRSGDGDLELNYDNWQSELRRRSHYIDHAKDMNFVDSSAHMRFSADECHSFIIPIMQQQQQQSGQHAPYLNHFPDTTSSLEQSMLSRSLCDNNTDHMSDKRYPFISPEHTAAIPISIDENFSRHNPDKFMVNDSLASVGDSFYPSGSQVSQGIQLYFDHILHFVPFIHKPSFDATRASRLLILSMLSLAYQHGEDPARNNEEGSGMTLSSRCFRQARILLESAEKNERDDCSKESISTIQAHLLLQICATMYLCGRYSEYGLQMHSKMIILARSQGLMQPIPVDSSATTDLDSLWQKFVAAESQKRTLFAIHQIDALWYQFFSIPRSLSHLEIKHDLPCPEDLWTASSSAQWAHRQLLGRHVPGSAMQYADAVRYFLSSDKNLTSLPAFDPYGAINIAQFLISSAREITGWSTMTGRLSMERLEPITSSLVALDPYIRPPQPMTEINETQNTPATLCEATWEMAMIELQIWSPLHTGGIVGGSVDAVLKIATDMAPSSEVLFESGTVQPHIDWFLRYLEATVAPNSEPPWVTFYAYKAFLVAWQLVNGGLAGAMQVVGVHDGDLKGATTWAKKVFQRRERWQLGKLIMACLDTLELWVLAHVLYYEPFKVK